MEKKKEQAKVLSQEMLADGIYSLWIETEAALTATPTVFEPKSKPKIRINFLFPMIIFDISL